MALSWRCLTRAGPGRGVRINIPYNSASGPRSVIRKSAKHQYETTRSFLGQVKVQVTKGHQMSNFAVFNIFLQIGS